MKTPRDVLLEQHRSAAPKLDRIREEIVTTLSHHRTTNSAAATDRRYSFREFVFSLRWHLAGMGAAWLLILLLDLNIGQSTPVASAMTATRIPPPQIILASLRENRRELLHLIQPAEPSAAPSRRLVPLQPRSERRDEIMAV